MKQKAKIEEELGDLLFGAIFAVKIASDERLIRQKEFYKRLEAKYRRRHPHVFGKRKARSREEALKIWQEWKQDIFDGIPKSLPALLQARLIQERAARYKFDWPGWSGPLKKIEEEVNEVRSALRQKKSKLIEIEIGDLLFSVVNLCRFLKIDAEDALRLTNRKFIRRFKAVIKELKKRGKRPADSSLVEMDRIWTRSKKTRSGKPRIKRQQ